jgi:5,10-methylenetetrahydromethanopterin reductase
MSSASTRKGGDSRRLGAYILPGRIKDPRDGLMQSAAGEKLKLGTLWLSERWGNKDIAALGGAMSQVAPSTKIAAGTTHFLTRHPVVVASMAMTLQALTNGKFILGIGRGVPVMFHAISLPETTFARAIDSVNIYRKLCTGQTVNYKGVLGEYTDMRLIDLPDVPVPPVPLAAIGPQSLKVAGAHFDGVILHPFLTPDAVARCRKIVCDAAKEAGRDPDAIKIYATVVTAADLPPDEEEAVVGGRAVTYFQNKSYAQFLVDYNGWDRAILHKLWNHPLFANLKGIADQAFTRQQLVEVSRVMPQEWFKTGGAVGTAAQCARRMDDFLAAGADEIIIHGSTPDQLGAVVGAFVGAY